jgi:hypothetical protein
MGDDLGFFRHDSDRDGGSLGGYAQVISRYRAIDFAKWGCVITGQPGSVGRVLRRTESIPFSGDSRRAI